MPTNDTIDRLDELIRRRSILEHPFYVAWTGGELTRPQLRRYAELYYPHVAAFPDYLRNAMATAGNPEVRRELEDNLSEELNEPKAHNELWLDFAEGLGADRARVEQTTDGGPGVETATTFHQLTSRGTAAAIAALYSYESQQPEVASLKASGLRELYGVEDEATVAYFDVHAEADVRHREGERAALESCLAEGASEAEVMQAAGEALDAYWGLLDRVCAETGVAAS